MNVLIATTDPGLAEIWARHLRREGLVVFATTSEETALTYLANNAADALVLDVHLEDGSAMAIADYASYRWPSARVVFVTNSTFFSDGSIFRLAPNAAAFLEHETPPGDLAAIVEYHAKAG